MRAVVCGELYQWMLCGTSSSSLRICLQLAGNEETDSIYSDADTEVREGGEW